MALFAVYLTDALIGLNLYRTYCARTLNSRILLTTTQEVVNSHVDAGYSLKDGTVLGLLICWHTAHFASYEQDDSEAYDCLDNITQNGHCYQSLQ